MSQKSFIVQHSAATFNPSDTTDLARLLERISKQMLFLALASCEQFFHTADVVFFLFLKNLSFPDALKPIRPIIYYFKDELILKYNVRKKLQLKVAE